MAQYTLTQYVRADRGNETTKDAQLQTEDMHMSQQLVRTYVIQRDLLKRT